MSYKRILIINNLKIINANALSSPYTVGFPAISAWLGATHAMQRKISEQGFDGIKFKKTGIICHNISLGVDKMNGYNNSIIGFRSTLDKNGLSLPFIERPRCQLEVSLVIEVEGMSKEDEEKVSEIINKILSGNFRFAGGDLVRYKKIEFLKIDEDSDEDFKKIARKCMPGYAIIERRELVVDAMNSGMDAIDAILEFILVRNYSEKNDDETVSWIKSKKMPGWLVPISVGFHGISDIVEKNKTKNARDNLVPHVFAESAVTIGEFVLPIRVNSIDDILWSYVFDKNNNTYLCTQQTKNN